MTDRWTRLGAICGLLLAVSWAPMAIVVGALPELDSADETERFLAAHGDALKLVIGFASLGFLFFLGYLGSLVERLSAADGSGPLARTAFASALMFMTLFNAAIGLDAAAGLLRESSTPEITHALHTAGFVLHAPAGFVGVAFFVATALLAFKVGALPRWLGWFAVVGVAANVGAIGGVFSASGPLNSGNGVLGGVALPLFAWVLWICLDSVATLRGLGPHASLGVRPELPRSRGDLGDRMRERMGGLRPPT
jgi:hypothetical protein